MSWSRRVRTWHRWLAIVVGLQLLAWSTSGLIFTWDPIEVVRGETFLAPEDPPMMPSMEQLVPLAEAVAVSGGGERAGASLAWRRGRWVWSLESAGPGAPTLVDASTGRPLPPLDAEEATRAAGARFAAPGSPVAVRRVTEARGEYRGKPVPAWRVTFDDRGNTNVYVDAVTGEVTSVRNDTWRRFDFFWMLHIMDYEERTDFHHPLLTIAAVMGVLTALSGLWLAALFLFPRRRRPV